MKMWMVAVCVALGLAACGTSGGGLRNDAYKQISEQKDEVVAYFNVEGALSNQKVANGFYRKLLGKTASGSFVVQDFYSRNNVKQSDPFIIDNESGLKAFTNQHTQGELFLYYANGAKMEHSVYEKGLLVSTSTAYYPSGTVFQTNQFENGKLNGRSQFYHPDGKLAANLEYVDGVLVNAEGWSSDGQSVSATNSAALLQQLQGYDDANMQEFKRLAQ